MGLVLDLVGDADGILRATEIALRAFEFDIEVLPISEAASFKFEPSNLPLNGIFREVASGSLAAFSIGFKDSYISHAVVYGPGYPSSHLNSWTCLIELKELNYEPLFLQLLDVPGLMVVSVEVEVTLELSDQSLSPATFPWQDSSLVFSAVRSDDRWIVKTGPYFHMISEQQRIQSP